jgi:[acyl-carrier-protein] S-malonyltransferase
MQPAAEAMAAALSEVAFHAPAVPLVGNVTAEASSDPDAIRARLVEQVTGRVRWRESVGYMAAQGVTETWEIGAGKALSGMVKRIDRSLEARTVGTPAEVQAASASLGDA